MGCDIHLFVEQRNGGGWRSADAWKQDEDEPLRKRVDYRDALYHDRNYSLFAILADVRNGYGFAGVDTGEGFVPISDPRGLPDDSSVEVKAESDSWDGDGHSHSYFTVAELLAYDWTRITRKRGVLTLVQYVRWNRWGRTEGEQPKEWCGDKMGGNTTIVDDGGAVQERLKPIIQDYNLRTDEQIDAALQRAGVGYTDVRCTWGVPYYQTCETFWSRTIPRLLRLGKPDDVRIVFWFDN
jgi:hypothetical protein